MESKFLPDEVVDLKIIYDYYGNQRATVTDVPTTVLHALNFSEFEEYVKQDIPHLRRLSTLRVSVLDDENTYVDMTGRNFRKFVKAVMVGQPKMNIKISDGTSPALSRAQAQTETTSDASTPSAKRGLHFEQETNIRYMSPSELDIGEKETQIAGKRKELDTLTSKYQDLSKEMNADVWRDRSKRVCHNCHGRKGHDRKKCNDNPCSDVRICGEVDLHPESKKQLNVLGVKKQKLEGEVNALSTELDAKRKANRETFNTFEGKIQSWLIRSNPEKYLISSTGQVRQVRVNADTAILRKVLNGQVPDDLETSSKFWPDLIEGYERKYNTIINKTPIINPVRRELENRGIQWPTHSATTVHPTTPNNIINFPTQNQMIPFGAVGCHPNANLGFQHVQQMAYGMPFYSPQFYGLDPMRLPTVAPSAKVTSGELEDNEIYPPLPKEPYPGMGQAPLPTENE